MTFNQGDILMNPVTEEFMLYVNDEHIIRNIGGTKHEDVISLAELRKVAEPYRPDLRVFNVLGQAVELGLAESKSEADRKFREGAIKIDGERVSSRWASLDFNVPHEMKIGYKTAVLEGNNA